jgi:hypothetical protein
MCQHEWDDLYHKVESNEMLGHVFGKYQDQDGLYRDDQLFVSNKRNYNT